MTTQRNIQLNINAHWQRAASGVRNFTKTVGDLNKKVIENKTVSRGFGDIRQQFEKMSGPANTGVVDKMNRSMKEGTNYTKAYGREIETFNEDLKNMSQNSTIGSRDLRRMTGDFDRFRRGVQAFQNLNVDIMRERFPAGSTMGKPGTFTGRHMAGFQYGHQGAIPGSPRFTDITGDSQIATKQEFDTLKVHMDDFGENLSEMNREAATVAKVFGDTTTSTSKFKRVMDAFEKSDLIDIVKIRKGPEKGGFGLTDQLGRIPGTPSFETEKEAEKFISVIGNMRESMDKTIRQQDEQNRRQGITFTNLLGLMIKFGIAMQIIQFPGKVSEMIKETGEDVVNLQQEVSHTRMLVPGLTRDIEPAFTEKLSDIAIEYKLGGEDPAIQAAKTAAIISSAVEIAPKSPGRIIGGKYFEPEIATVLDLTEKAIFAATTTKERPENIARSISRISAGLQVPAADFDKFIALQARTVDVGDLSSAQYAQAAGEFVGPLSAIFKDASPERMFEEMRSMMGIFATQTLTLNPDQARTGMRNIFSKIRKPSKPVREAMGFLKKATREAGFDETIDLTLGALQRKGVQQYWADIPRLLGPDSELMNKFIKSKGGQKAVTEGLESGYYDTREEAEKGIREEKYEEWMNFLFPNIRAIRALDATYIKHGETLDEVNRKLEEVTYGEVAVDSYLKEMHRRSTETAKNYEDMAKEIEAAGRRGDFDAEKITEKRGQRGREAQLNLEFSDMPKTFTNWITNPLNVMNPAIWNVTPYSFGRDVKQVGRALKHGVPAFGEGGLYEFFKAPPRGLAGSSEQDFYDWFQLVRNETGLFDMQPAPRVSTYNANTQRILDVFSQIDYSKFPSANFIPSTPDFAGSYEPGSAAPIPASSLVPGNNVTGNTFEINVTLQGANATNEEDGQSIGEIIVDWIDGILNDESYNDATLSVLHRTVEEE